MGLLIGLALADVEFKIPTLQDTYVIYGPILNVVIMTHSKEHQKHHYQESSIPGSNFASRPSKKPLYHSPHVVELYDTPLRLLLSLQPLPSLPDTPLLDHRYQL